MFSAVRAQSDEEGKSATVKVSMGSEEGVGGDWEVACLNQNGCSYSTVVGKSKDTMVDDLIKLGYTKMDYLQSHGLSGVVTND